MSTGPTRRHFFRRLAAGAVLLPTGLSGEEPILPLRPTGDVAPDPSDRPLPRDGVRDERFWQQVRARFAFREERVPMNAANLCPSPRTVADEVSRLTHDIDVDCSFQNRAKYDDRLEASRTAVARQLGVDPDEVALVRNTSEANNTVNGGLPLDPGDEVVVWDQNHPTNNVAWDVRAARYGIRVVRVSVPARPTASGELVDPFVQAFTDRTRVVALTHVSNLSGIRLPVAEIAAAAHRRGIHVHVDGAQSFGAMELDLRELGCDTYTGSAHKWFMGPKEAGVLYVRGELVDRIWATGVAPGWGADATTDLAGARKFESLGQRDDACLAAVATAAAFHDEIGPAAVEARVTELASVLKEGVSQLGVPLVTPVEPSLSGGVCILEVAGDARAVFERVYAEHGLAAAATGGLRFSPHVYNTRAHVERAVAAVEALRDEIAG